MLKGRKTAVPLLLIAAGGLVVGLAVPAAAHEASHLIDGKSIAIQSIPGNRLKVNTLTGRQIKESTLGTVPHATEAQKLPALVWHSVTLENGWTTSNPAYGLPKWAVDAQGIVHLRGFISGGTIGATAFTLPAAESPVHFAAIPVLNNSATESYLYVRPTGTLGVFNTAGDTNAVNGVFLNGLTFSTN
jgi:hypothetical protein